MLYMYMNIAKYLYFTRPVQKITKSLRKREWYTILYQEHNAAMYIWLCS